MSRYFNIHHRRSIRLKGYDYSHAGLYFITICCHDHKCLFGRIANHEMILNDAGKIANECWLEIPNHFPDSILHDHIIMPNHIHGIIELIKNVRDDTVGAENFLPLHPDLPLQPDPGNNKNFIPERNYNHQRNEYQKMIPRSIPSIVKGFKIGVTKWFRGNSITVGAENFLPPQIWQRNYYETIIRNEQSHRIISKYIIENPANWDLDKFYIR